MNYSCALNRRSDYADWGLSGVFEYDSPSVAGASRFYGGRLGSELRRIGYGICPKGNRFYGFVVQRQDAAATGSAGWVVTFWGHAMRPRMAGQMLVNGKIPRLRSG